MIGKRTVDCDGLVVVYGGCGKAHFVQLGFPFDGNFDLFALENGYVVLGERVEVGDNHILVNKRGRFCCGVHGWKFNITEGFATI